MQAEDRGFTDVLTMTFPTATGIEACRAEAYEKAKKLIRRAQEQGELRNDFVPGDLIWLLMANGTYLQATRSLAPDAWKRYVELILDALRADASEPLPPAPTDEQLRQAMLSLNPAACRSGGRVD